MFIGTSICMFHTHQVINAIQATHIHVHTSPPSTTGTFLQFGHITSTLYADDLTEMVRVSTFVSLTSTDNFDEGPEHFNISLQPDTTGCFKAAIFMATKKHILLMGNQDISSCV